MNECVLMLFSLNIFIVDSIFLVSNQSVKFHDLVSLDFYRRIDISTYPISLFFLVSQIIIYLHGKTYRPARKEEVKARSSS